MPEGFSPDEKKAWRKLLGQLSGVPGLLSKIDGAQLERYVRFLIRWRAIEAEIVSIIAAAGASWKVLAKDELRPAIRGLWTESGRLNHQLKQIEDAFGMSPAARARLRTGAKDEPEVGDPDADFFGVTG